MGTECINTLNNENNQEQQFESAWIIVSKSFNKSYEIQQNDHIKLGRARLRVVEINMKNKQQVNTQNQNEEDSQYDSQECELEGSDLQKQD